jgi:hypothetical protein
LKLNNPDTFTLRDISTASEAGASGNNGPVKKRMVRARHLGQSMRQHISLPWSAPSIHEYNLSWPPTDACINYLCGFYSMYAICTYILPMNRLYGTLLQSTRTSRPGVWFDRRDPQI